MAEKDDLKQLVSSETASPSTDAGSPTNSFKQLLEPKNDHEDHDDLPLRGLKTALRRIGQSAFATLCLTIGLPRCSGWILRVSVVRRPKQQNLAFDHGERLGNESCQHTITAYPRRRRSSVWPCGCNACLFGSGVWLYLTERCCNGQLEQSRQGEAKKTSLSNDARPNLGSKGSRRCRQY